MPDYEEGYKAGFGDGYREGFRVYTGKRTEAGERRKSFKPPKKRQLSAWNKFVKANSKKPRFIYRNGKLNLKKMGVAFRKTPAGKKKRKR